MSGSSRFNPFGTSPISRKGGTPFSTIAAVTPWDDQSLDAPVPPSPSSAASSSASTVPVPVEPPGHLPQPEPTPLAAQVAAVEPLPVLDPPAKRERAFEEQIAHLAPPDETDDHRLKPAPEPSLHLLGVLTDPEPLWKRSLYLGLAFLFTGAFAFFLMAYWAPAAGRPGIDENGYLVGGRNFAEHGTTGFKPSDNYQFVGAMWVRTKEEVKVPGGPLPAFLKKALTAHVKDGWYFPKYPLGVSALNAAAIKLTRDRQWAFLVSPLGVVMAVLGVFFFTRAVAGSFYGLLSMILMGTGYVTLSLANIPSSHAPALGFVVWGMFLLLRWCQTGSWWRGILAGFFLGCAVTVRYTEALLLFPLYPLDQVLHDTDLSKYHPHWWQVIKVVRLLPVGPLGLAVVLSLRWKKVKSYFAASLPILAWAVPVTYLVAFNWFSMGQVTGYDQTNESQGFTTAEFLKKWDFTVEQIHLFGMFLILPLGLMGLALSFRRSVKLGLLLTTWFLPGVLLYNAYYWGDRMQGIGFLRFFLTLFPPLIIAAMWLLHSATAGARVSDGWLSPRRRGSVAAPIGAGLLTAACAGVGLFISLPDMERQHRGNMNLQYSATRLLARIEPKALARVTKTSPATRPTTPVFFADEGVFPQFLQYLQFLTDADCYTVDAFNLRFAGGFGLFGIGQKTAKDDRDAPVLLQAARIDFMTEFFKDKSAAQLVEEQHKVVDEALRNGRPVFAVLTPVQAIEFKRRFITGEYEAVELEHWTEPCAVRFPDDERPNKPAGMQTRVSPLAPKVSTMEPIIRWQPQELTLVQIRRKAEVTRGD